jgi:pilus assembly protein CpaC
MKKRPLLMARFSRAVLVLALIAAAFTAKTSAQTASISLETGGSTLIDTPGLVRVAVGDNKIAGVVPVGTSQVVINGKAPGRTIVYVWTDFDERRYQVIVSGQDTNDLARMIRATIGEPNVNVVTFDHAVIVRGTVGDLSKAQNVAAIIDRFSKLAAQESMTIVDAVTVPRPMGQISEELSNMPGSSGIRLDPDADGNVIVSGRVHSRTEAEQVLDRARGLAGPFLSAKGQVIDRLEVDLTSQVDIKVYVLEIDKTGLSQLGVRLQGAQLDPGTATGYLLGLPTFPFQEGPQASGLGKAFNIGAFFRDTFLAPTLDLILQSGHARELSAPDLVTLPGKEATFMVGGQIPYEYSTGLGTVSIQFVNYGVMLDITPTILANGKVECKINPTVSDLDYANGVSLGGSVVPALKVSTIKTDVITSDGEGIIMGGLLKHYQEKDYYKVPLLSAIPILGKLFQSVRYQNQETDVVFVMTPVIINQ